MYLCWDCLARMPRRVRVIHLLVVPLRILSTLPVLLFALEDLGLYRL
jgi:hypothetical protein